MTLPTRTLDRRQLLGIFGITGLTTLVGLTSAGAQRSPFATPTAEAPPSATADSPLQALLDLVPLAAVATTNDTGTPWSYVNLAAQFDALGMQHGPAGPDFENEPVANATFAFGASNSVFSFVMVEELIAAIGFQPLGMNQVLYAGAPGSQIELFRGNFDAGALVDAWTAAGYQPVETASGIPAWSSGPDGEFSPDHPVQRYLVGSMNNLAIVDDVLIATSRMPILESVLSFHQDGGESLMADPATGSLVATLPETVASAIALQPTALASTPFDLEEGALQEDELAAIAAEFGPMPPIQGVIAAVNAGAMLIDSDWGPNGTPVATPRPDAGTAEFRLQLGTAEEAEQARVVFTERWQRLNSLVSGALPYAEIMELSQSSTVDDIVELSFRLLRSPNSWIQMIMTRDVLPFVPGPD
jgi:hypothetical protein